MTETPGLLNSAADKSWRILVVLALAAVVTLVGITLAAVIVPALLAVVVVPVGRPLFKWLEGRMPGSAAAALVLLLALAILVAAFWLITASIAANWDAMRRGIADATVVIAGWVDDRVSGLTDAQVADIRNSLGGLARSVTDVLVGGVTKGVAALGAFFVGLLFFLMTLYFGLRDWDKFRAWVVASVSTDLQAKTDTFLDRYSTILRNYWKGQALIGLFDAIAMGFGLWLIGVPLVVPIAVLTFVVSFIPYVGAIIAGAVAVFVALGTGGGGDGGLTLLLSLFVFNTGENLMRPWLVGETIQMPTFVVFISSTVGVLVAGAFGAILAIPLVALAGEFRRVFLTDDAAAEPGHRPSGEEGTTD
jgi:predicted PurR-regulated permease PerM